MIVNNFKKGNFFQYHYDPILDLYFKKLDWIYV